MKKNSSKEYASNLTEPRGGKKHFSKLINGESQMTQSDILTKVNKKNRE